MTQVDKSYFTDGTLRSETPILNGVPHGVVQHWHSNGKIALRIPMADGLVNGVVRQWDADGNLLGTYRMSNGTGVEIKWSGIGQIGATCSYINGNRNGPARVYDDEGELLGEGYWVDDKPVIWEKYLLACERDANLPNSLEDKPQLPAKIAKLKELEARIGPAGMADLLPERLIQGERTREALEWLQENRARSLGEGRRHGKSVNSVTKLYELGAKCVYAVEIDQYVGGEENTGKLVVELPNAEEARVQLLKYGAKIGQRIGFTKDEDVKQKYMLLLFD